MPKIGKKPLDFTLEDDTPAPHPDQPEARMSKTKMSIRLEPDLFVRFKVLSVMTGQNMQDLGQLAIAEYLDNHPLPDLGARMAQS